MFWLRAALCALSAALPLAVAAWLFRRVVPRATLPRRVALVAAGIGGGCAFLAVAVERWILEFADLSFRGEGSRVVGSALAMLLVAAPLEEALKVAAVWRPYTRGELSSGRLGAIAAVCASAGFAAVETLLLFFVWGGDSWLDVARGAIALPAHLFFAALWGYALGRSSHRGFWFPATWAFATVLHGVYDHVVFGRGPALLVVVIPLLLLMGTGLWILLRDANPESDRPTAPSIFEPPTVAQMRRVITSRGQPLMVHWIAFGALVTLGVTLVCLALAVYAGHRMGVDFALADEAELGAAVPLVLLGSAVLAAFPISGYLVARASGTESVLEPAWATGAAIAVVMVLLSVTDPLSLVVALTVVPVAFALACAGAWFGLRRT